MVPFDWYRDINTLVSQGDIFETAPHPFLRDRPKQISLTMANRKAGFLVDEFCGAELPKSGSEIVLPAPTLVGHAVLLTHGCEVDKDNRHRVIALIRPINILNKEEERETVRKNGKMACFHLPPLSEKLPESFIDFRRITTVGVDWLPPDKRTASLSEPATHRMLLAMFRFFARLELEPNIFVTGNANEE